MIQLPTILLTLLFAGIFAEPTPPAKEEPAAPVVTINQMEAPVRLTATLPENLLDAKQAAKTSIDYTPGDSQTWHFDRDGKLVTTPDAKGYYRQSLGKTADGRLVVQDYYQDTHTPQTAPIILPQGADPQNFNSSNSDSKNIWYQRNGEIHAMQDYRDGKPVGRHNIYHDGRLIAQMPQQEGVADPDNPYRDNPLNDGLRLYYPGGKILAFIKYQNGESHQNLYREDGSPILALIRDQNGEIREIARWDKDGDYLEDKAYGEELKTITERQKTLLEYLENDPADLAADLEKPADQPQLLPENVLDAAKAAENPLGYSADSEAQTWYFDQRGEPTDNAQNGGYHRKSLGKTADGRLVAQDYYQDSGKPQTAPFILKKDADPHNFNVDNADSKIIWYREDGSIESIQTYRDGKPAGRQNHYQNGRLIAQMPLPEGVEENDDPYRSAGEISRGYRFYYPSGHLLALTRFSAESEQENLYREDGKILSAHRTNDPNGKNEQQHWSAYSSTPPAELEKLKEAHEKAGKLRRAILDSIIAEQIAPPPAAEAENSAPAEGEKPAPAAETEKAVTPAEPEKPAAEGEKSEPPAEPTEPLRT